MNVHPLEGGRLLVHVASPGHVSDGFMKAQMASAQEEQQDKHHLQEAQSQAPPPAPAADSKLMASGSDSDVELGMGVFDEDGPGLDWEAPAASSKQDGDAELLGPWGGYGPPGASKKGGKKPAKGDHGRSAMAQEQASPGNPMLFQADPPWCLLRRRSSSLPDSASPQIPSAAALSAPAAASPTVREAGRGRVAPGAGGDPVCRHRGGWAPRAGAGQKETAAGTQDLPPQGRRGWLGDHCGEPSCEWSAKLAVLWPLARWETGAILARRMRKMLWPHARCMSRCLISRCTGCCHRLSGRCGCPGMNKVHSGNR